MVVQKGAKQVILLRHGRTEWNAAARLQGQADIPLDALGVQQAELAAEVLSRRTITEIWASDLSRARVTAQAVAERVGLQVRTDPAFREIHVGQWQGLTLTELHDREPDLADRYAAGEDVRRSSTGETTGEVGDRVAARLKQVIATAADDATVLVGMHGLAAKTGALTFVGVPHSLWDRFDGLTNCHWIELRRTHQGDWRIHAWNVGPDNFLDGEQPIRTVGN